MLKTKLSRAEHEALEESLKSLYVADGENFKLDADYEDVTGLKQSKTDLLRELKELKEKYGDLDPAKAKEALEAAQAAEDEKLKAAGEFEKLKEALIERHKGELEKAKTDHDTLLGNLRRESLKNLLTSKGVLPDRIRGMIAEGDLENVLEFEYGETGPKFKKKGGVGDEPELDSLFTDLKSKYEWGFKANGASGSGASGSQQNGGGTSQQWTRQQWDAASTQERTAFSEAGGTMI